MGFADLFGAFRGLAAAGASRAAVLDATALAVGTRRIPDDVRELLWFVDGPLRNYEVKARSESVSSFEHVNIRVSFYGPSEPSAISVKAPIASPRDEVARLRYYPSYEGMTPEQRWTYLSWLTDVTQPVDTGYVFVFYYGLERHLFGRRADQAVDMILRLRQSHSNRSFLAYSSDALLTACLMTRRQDWLLRYAESLNSVDEVTLSDVYLNAKRTLGLEMSPAEMVAIAGKVGFTSRRYVRGEPTLFEEELVRALEAKFGVPSLSLTRYSLRDCPASHQVVFANYSLDRERSALQVPSLFGNPMFASDARELLVAAHEAVKQRLKDLRAAGAC